MGPQSSPKNSLQGPKKIKIALQKQKYQKDKKEKSYKTEFIHTKVNS